MVRIAYLSDRYVFILLHEGHAYAAGAILALVHDVRVMRKERGWFCLPEIKINRSFTISTMEMVKYIMRGWRGR